VPKAPLKWCVARVRRIAVPRFGSLRAYDAVDLHVTANGAGRPDFEGILSFIRHRCDRAEAAAARLKSVPMRNVLSVDVEEYFHPVEIPAATQFGRWPSLPSRVEFQTQQVLEMLAVQDVCGTFFVLGWVAEHHPGLIRRIAAAGHEIGCHSFSHRLVYNLSPVEFKRDTERAIQAIQDACGVTPRVYRAPSYSITNRSLWALEVLVELGFTHDSSIYPIQHDRYGIPGFGRHVQTLRTASGSIQEVPVATVQVSANRVTPVGGGGYLRLLPYRYTAAGIRRINEDEQAPACIYFHPWELDPDQPRLASTWTSRLRTYTGLRGMASKVDRLLRDFQFSTITSVHPVPVSERGPVVQFVPRINPSGNQVPSNTAPALHAPLRPKGGNRVT
jgi:polysaccharide deacetylase family protein (PEP-CTERM system associated)